MISVRDAFHPDTTVWATIETFVDGSWDEDNQWTQGSYTDPKKFRVTPFPAGNVADSVFGETLKAEFYGERSPEFKRFFSKTEMPINTRITYREGIFKVIRLGDYKAGGYWEVLAAKILEQT